MYYNVNVLKCKILFIEEGLVVVYFFSDSARSSREM